jgi:mono/diheme cytochrome c family protein
MLPPIFRSLVPSVRLAFAGIGLSGIAVAEEAGGTHPGLEIYTRHCAECHGANGEGSKENRVDPMDGSRSLAALARYIDRTMPEDEPKLVSGEDAEKVAAYIMEAFYGPEARARQTPVPPKAVARLTNRQFRESIADLIGSFGEIKPQGEGRGLTGQYFQSNGMNKKDRKAFEREDAALDFDFGPDSPGGDITADQFSIAWDGSLRVNATGWYEFRLSTPNGARFYLNGEAQEGDSNRRDDSSARRQPALIESWVSSGEEVREEKARVFLLGGRAYPIRLDYFKYQEPRGMIRLEWKPPQGEWAVLSAPFLSPAPATHVAVVSTAFPADDASEGYERGTAVSRDWHEATTAAALEVAGQVVARLDKLTDSKEGQPEREARIKEFLTTLASRAFRRPLDDEQRQRYIDRPFEGGVAPEEAVKRSVLLIIKSPRFLYPEIGTPKDPFTVASRLALGLWDSLPDPALIEAASSGNLRTEDQVREQARRMLADPRATAKLSHFFRNWLKLDAEADLQKDREKFPEFDAALLADLRRSLELFIEHVVTSEGSDLRELLLADYLFVNERLAKLYDLPVPEGGGFQPVKADPARRAGVITHPFLLTRLAHHDVTSPIHRGVFLTRNILGGVLKAPPEAIAFENHKFDPSMSMREKVTEMTRDKSCMTCHHTINPLGFSLENFDALGRFRLREDEKPIDPESDYLTQEGEVLRLRGPRDVADHAAESAMARRGFVRQLFQNSIKQTPLAYGHETVERLDQSFSASGQQIRELFVEINVLAALDGIDPQATASR